MASANKPERSTSSRFSDDDDAAPLDSLNPARHDNLSSARLSEPVLVRSFFLTWHERTIQRHAFESRLNKLSKNAFSWENTVSDPQTASNSCFDEQ
jgi:hypothetical protein